jgi:PQQ system protein
VTTTPDERVGDRGSELAAAGLDGQNRTALGRLLGTGNIGYAEEGPDGILRATVRIPQDELIWDPCILVFPRGGDIELTLINDDKNTHCAVLPCNGDPKILWLVNHSKGRARLNLDGPGIHWYSSTTGNDEGRGLCGALVLGGEVPDSAKIDRPPQPRP